MLCYLLTDFKKEYRHMLRYQAVCGALTKRDLDRQVQQTNALSLQSDKHEYLQSEGTTTPNMEDEVSHKGLRNTTIRIELNIDLLEMKVRK